MHANARDLTGQQFGLLTALVDAGESRSESRVWWVRCKCGVVKKVLARNLVSGGTQSCDRHKHKTGSKHNFGVKN